MHYWRRSFWALVGVAVLGFGSAVLRVAQVGVDPYTAANIGISNTIGLDLGTYQLISNAVLLIPVFFFFTEKVNKPLMKKDLAAHEAFQERVKTTRWHF
ncbi:hypothetical protein JVX93_02065 [Mycolicibacterium boenickei]|nr:hypothetical protein JVX93_02065 [Mycolicibacterium boenickei]